MTWFRREKDYIIYNLSRMSENEVLDMILKRWENFRKENKLRKKF